MKSEDHPIGFKKIVLFSLRGYRVRLHIWPNGEGNDSRHSHRWWFVSMPLIGCFIDTRYRETTGDLLKINVSDQDGIRDSARAYRLQGNSGLKTIKRRIRYPLLPYLCRIGEIHSYLPRGHGLHVSLVVVSPLKTETSQIWRSPDRLDVDLP